MKKTFAFGRFSKETEFGVGLVFSKDDPLTGLRRGIHRKQDPLGANAVFEIDQRRSAGSYRLGDVLVAVFEKEETIIIPMMEILIGRRILNPGSADAAENAVHALFLIHIEFGKALFPIDVMTFVFCAFSSRESSDPSHMTEVNPSFSASMHFSVIMPCQGASFIPSAEAVSERGIFFIDEK